MSDMRTDCEIAEESLARLPEYSEIPIRFEVRSLFEIEGDDPDSAVLVEQSVEPPWIKDYDAIKGEGPTGWPERWDVTNWGLLAAYVDGRRVAGCVLAHNTDGVNKLEGRDGMIVLWDLRVHPDWRGRGIGHRPFESAVQWARDRQCRRLKIETQNINVAACRFYERQGCRLSSISRSACEDCPEEVELVWSLAL
jgi:ribosomal protein S18 acetylase RimI-like enzyme